jgi:ParB family transcriptional regulator, chromosome partitioning protein
MSRKATIDTLFVRKSDSNNVSVTGDNDRVRTGAISAMGTSLKELTEGAKAAARLQEQIDTGAAVVELDPVTLDSSMVTDRLTAEIDPSFDALIESLRTSGQQVPILVRPHPDQTQRYQIAYGHRRVRAAVLLGIKVRAVVRPLTNDELVVAQGKENLDRRDLSYIEKALFARRLEDQGFERGVIMAALSTDKADLSRYISVARMIPEPLAQSIGPASKVGRARWVALSERLGQPRSDKIVSATVASDDFRRLDSDSRFSLVFEALSKSSGKALPKPKIWTNTAGQKAGRIEHRADRTVLTIDETIVPEFGSFLAGRLDDLYEQFLKTQREEVHERSKPTT